MYLIKVEYKDDEPMECYVDSCGNLTSDVNKARVMAEYFVRNKYNDAVRRYRDATVTVHKVTVTYNETPIEF